jgi:hypothetical protein
MGYSNFPSYVIASALRGMGWPKRSGRLRTKRIVNAYAADSVVEAMVMACVGLGAASPLYAVKVITSAFDAWDDVRRNLNLLDVEELVRSRGAPLV